MTAPGKPVATPTERAGHEQLEASAAGWYLYGITRSGGAQLPWQALKAIPGVDATTMQACVRGELAAIVRQVALADFEPDVLRERLSDLAALEAMARAHNAVIAAIHAQQAILPAKFGSVYASLDDLGASLDDAQARFLDALRRLDDCDEWAVHLYADRALIAERVTQDDPDLQRRREEIAASSPGRAYFLQRTLDRETAAAVENRLAEWERDMVAWLRPLTKGLVSQSVPLAGEETRAGDVEIMRAALLLERSRRDRVLRDLHTKIDGEVGLRVEIGGPWPPYSFVTEPEEGRDEP